MVYCVCRSRMTKRETNFADEDSAMALRALWLLEGNSPTEEPPANLGLERLHSYAFVNAEGFLPPLAHFGIARHDDATRDTPPSSLLQPEDGSNPEITAARQRERVQAEACVAEKQADEALRAAGVKLHRALEYWRSATEKRAEQYGHVRPAMLGGGQLAVLADLGAAEQATAKALASVEDLRRHHLSARTFTAFPSTLGLPLSERAAVLNAQALRLKEAGHSLEEIAYVMGWNVGTPQQVRDRTRKRLAEAESSEK